MNQLTEKSTKSFSIGVRFLIMTLMKEINPVITDRHLFDIWDESILVTIFRKFWTIRILMQGSDSLFFQPSPPLRELGFLLTPCWKIVFLFSQGNWSLIFDVSHQKKFFIHWSVWILMQKPAYRKSNLNLFFHCEAFDCDPHEKNQTCS